MMNPLFWLMGAFAFPSPHRAPERDGDSGDALAAHLRACQADREAYDRLVDARQDAPPAGAAFVPPWLDSSPFSQPDGHPINLRSEMAEVAIDELDKTDEEQLTDLTVLLDVFLLELGDSGELEVARERLREAGMWAREHLRLEESGR